MYVCMYVCMCVYVCMYVCVYVCMCVCVCVYVCMYECKFMCTCALARSVFEISLTSGIAHGVRATSVPSGSPDHSMVL